MENNADILKEIKQFLAKIDIVVKEGKVMSNPFLRGVEIRNGELIYDPEKLMFPGDLLHEAGHIAIAPPDTRQTLQNDVAKFGQGPAEEMAAIAWSWAALTAIGLAPSIVFHKDGYKGESPNIIKAFSEGFGFGYPMLSYWRMCEPLGEHPLSFPNMRVWLRQPSITPSLNTRNLM